jgi:hypothetical protein
MEIILFTAGFVKKHRKDCVKEFNMSYSYKRWYIFLPQNIKRTYINPYPANVENMVSFK